MLHELLFDFIKIVIPAIVFVCFACFFSKFNFKCLLDYSSIYTVLTKTTSKNYIAVCGGGGSFGMYFPKERAAPVFEMGFGPKFSPRWGVHFSQVLSLKLCIVMRAF